MNEEMRQQIARAANEDVPKEACGFILDTGAVVHCTNVDDAPWYRFLIDPEEARYWYGSGRVIGVWHSHPTGPAVPSEGDELEALSVSFKLAHMIYSVEDEDLATYTIVNGRLQLATMASPA